MSKKIPYRLMGNGDRVYERIISTTNPNISYYTNFLVDGGVKNTDSGIVIPEKEIKLRIKRLEEELEYLKTFY